jgi:transcriptional regulator with XRE-family HTH domain
MSTVTKPLVPCRHTDRSGTVWSHNARRQALARRRRTRGYSQEALAEVVGVDRSTVARWESGQTEPQPWHRRKIATALDVTLQELDTLLGPATISDQQPGQRTYDLPPLAVTVDDRADLTVAAHTTSQCPHCRSAGCPRLARALIVLLEHGSQANSVTAEQECYWARLPGS